MEPKGLPCSSLATLITAAVLCTVCWAAAAVAVKRQRKGPAKPPAPILPGDAGWSVRRQHLALAAANESSTAAGS